MIKTSLLPFLETFQTVYVGYSGGLDSSVLLHAATLQSTLNKKLHAIHINHALSSDALAWETHCIEFCAKIKVPLSVQRVSIDPHSNIEENARLARLEVFESLLSKEDCILLAHHCEDQAETLLLNLFRGAGIDGLAGMQIISMQRSGWVLIRPFLDLERVLLKAHARQYQLKWIDDPSNFDTAFSRNYLRHKIIPLLKEKWPGISKNLARTARHCQEANTLLRALALKDVTNFVSEQLSLESLGGLEEGRFKNVLRAWFKENGVRPPGALLLDRLLHELCWGRSGSKTELKWDQMVVRRYQQTLYLLRDHPPLPVQPLEWLNFPSPRFLYNDQDKPIYLSAALASSGVCIPKGCSVQIRFRTGGERFFWHGQTKSLKKLFQQWGVPPWKRDTIPLLYIKEDLAAVVGYAVSDTYFGQDAQGLYGFSIDKRER